MSLQESLRRLSAQYEWEPSVERGEALRPQGHVIVAGMGGSALGASLIRHLGPRPHLFVHRDYGLPLLPEAVMTDALLVLSSYSGTTEEVLDAGREGLQRGLPMAAISTGGKLLEFAREHALPAVQLPDMELEPRLAIGLTMIALAHLLDDIEIETAVREAGKAADPMLLESAGRQLGEKLIGKIPLIYASEKNFPLAYLWKVKCNENAKIPAFSNVFPELCHNELSGFDAVEATAELSRHFHAILLEDEEDHPRVHKRMEVFAQMLAERSIPVERVAMGRGGFAAALASAALCDWATIALSEHSGVPNPDTPIIKSFKERIGQ